MPYIEVENLGGRRLQVNDQESTLLNRFFTAGMDWMHACGGKGRCTTCRVIVTKGLENLCPPTEAEQKYLRQGTLQANERLTCQARLMGDVSVKVPKDCMLPHVDYREG